MFPFFSVVPSIWTNLTTSIIAFVIGYTQGNKIASLNQISERCNKWISCLNSKLSDSKQSVISYHQSYHQKHQVYQITFDIFYKIVALICKVIYELWLTYVSVIESYVDEFKIDHKKEPEWYWYPWFYVGSVGYMLLCAKTILVRKYQDQQKQKQTSLIVDNVKVINDKSMSVSYEWKNKSYSILLPIDRMHTNELLSACVVDTNNVDQENKDVTEQIKQYLGPLEDWHQQQYTPQQLGFGYPLIIRKMNVDTFETIEKVYQDKDMIPSISKIE